MLWQTGKRNYVVSGASEYIDLLPNLISNDTRLAHNNSEVPTWPIPFSRTALAWVNDCSLDK